MTWQERLHPRDGDGKFRTGEQRLTDRAAHVALHGATLSQADFDPAGRRDEGDVVEQAARALAARWKVSDADLDELAAEEGIHPDATDAAGKREAVARILIWNWQGSSGGPAATMATDAVRERLGLPDNLNESSRRIRAWVAERPGIDRALRSFGNAMYDSTQQWLAERGIDAVDASRAGFTDDRKRPFTSWALSHGGMRHEAGRVERHERIPARLVFSTPATGFGTLAESELVVLPGW